MRKYLFLVLSACCLSWNAWAQKTYDLISPNGEIKVSVRLEDKIYYDISCNDEVLLKDNAMRLMMTDRTLGEMPKLSKKKQNSVKETLTPVVPLKFSKVDASSPKERNRQPKCWTRNSHSDSPPTICSTCSSREVSRPRARKFTTT